MSRLAALALGLCCTGCLGAVGIPPSRTDLASIAQFDGNGGRAGLRLAVGAHWASAVPRDTSVDVGAGVIVERTASNATPVEHGASAASPPARTSRGAYIELARRLGAGRAHRSWLALRTEMVLDDRLSMRHVALGASTRLAWELFTAGAFADLVHDRCGAALILGAGTVAAGVYVDLGYRPAFDGPGGVFAAAGITFRLPTAGAVGVGLCR